MIAWGVALSVSHPHEGSGGDRLLCPVHSQLRGSAIPMRGQEMRCGFWMPSIHRVSHPHEGSGEGRPDRDRRHSRPVSHPHEGSGGGRDRRGRRRRYGSAIPMRGQETRARHLMRRGRLVSHPHEGSGERLRRAAYPAALVSHPHEGSGADPAVVVRDCMARSAIPMRGQETIVGEGYPEPVVVSHPHEGSGDRSMRA